MAIIQAFKPYLVNQLSSRQNINVTNATIAQLVEHLIRNERVVGSNPISSSIEKNFEPCTIPVAGFFLVL